MSRIGKLPVSIPDGVTTTLTDDILSIKGPLGELKMTVNPLSVVKIENNQIIVSPKNDSRPARAMYGTTRALIANMVIGVTKGYEKVLELIGVGYKAEPQGTNLKLSLGFSHPIVVKAVEGTKIEVDKEGKVHVSGTDKQAVGELAANIRKFRPPEPYKGKGVRYIANRDGKGAEHIRRKAGKTVGK